MQKLAFPKEGAAIASISVQSAVKVAEEDGRVFKVQGRGGRGGDDHRRDTGVHRDHDRRVCRATSHHRK